MQNHCSADLWKESNSVSAVISVLWWVCGHIGCLHIWCDNEVVVSHFKELQQGLATPECFEHADLWRQVQVLLREATVELLINKVYSHVVNPRGFLQNLEQSGSPSGTCQHFQRVWKGLTIGIFGNNESSCVPVL